MSNLTERPNVVILLLDCLRADHMGCYGYHRNTSPALDALAHESLQFNDVLPQAPWTLPSHTSLFTGLYPTEHGLMEGVGEHLPRLDGRIQTLASSLADAGYATAMFSNNPWVGPPTGLDAGFDLVVTDDMRIHLPEEGTTGLELLAPFQRMLGPMTDQKLSLMRKTKLTVDLMAKYVRAMRGGDRSFFIFTNLMEMHQPYFPPQKWVRWLDPDMGKASVKQVNATYEAFRLGRHALDQPLADEDVERVTVLYDASLRYLDGEVGRFVEELRRGDQLDDTLLFVTSDHGRALGRYSRREELEFPLNEEHTSIPLLVRPSEGMGSDRGVAMDIPVELTDIYDTVVAATGIDGGQVGRVREGADLAEPDGIEPARVRRSEYVFPHEATSDILREAMPQARFDALAFMDYLLFHRDDREGELYQRGEDRRMARVERPSEREGQVREALEEVAVLYSRKVKATRGRAKVRDAARGIAKDSGDA